jgi:release factor glutamine methyltransferase
MMNPPNLRSVLDYLQVARDLFRKKEIPEARLEAELLLSHALGCDRVALYVRYDQPLTPDETRRFGDLLRQRGRRVPVQYIMGYRDFWKGRLAVEPGVLIPRPETECLIEEVLALHRGREAPRRIADVGTGSGAIAIALAGEFPEVEVWAGDIAEAPIRVATANAASAGVADRVHVLRARGLAPLFAAAGAPFDLVVSNPPYITAAAFATLQPEVREHEPVEALVAGADGLDVLRAITDELAAGDLLAPGGMALLEIGEAHQVEPVRAMLKDAGFGATHVRKDYADLPRIIVGTDFRLG